MKPCLLFLFFFILRKVIYRFFAIHPVTPVTSGCFNHLRWYFGSNKVQVLYNQQVPRGKNRRRNYVATKCVCKSSFVAAACTKFQENVDILKFERDHYTYENRSSVFSMFWLVELSNILVVVMSQSSKLLNMLGFTDGHESTHQ